VQGLFVGTIKTTVNVVGKSADSAAVIVSGPDRFTKVSIRTSQCFGSRWAFLAAIAVIVIWASTGPLFHYSDTWQLVINTGTTIVTFLNLLRAANLRRCPAIASRFHGVSVKRQT
jgi:hypothetical protein